MIQTIKTLNSTYEVDLATEFVRRIEGTNPTVLDVPDGTWIPYVERRKVYDDGGRYAYVFFLTEGQDIAWFRTSLVESELTPAGEIA